MKCLLTGATGFLGKQVLDLLLEDPRIQTVHITSRKKKTHPNPKVRLHQANLSAPWSDQEYLTEVDAILHLAGLYTFDATFEEHYKNNILPVLNLVDWAHHSTKKPQILFASTYAVGLGSSLPVLESKLTHIPHRIEPYSYTKAVAEKVLSDSGLKSKVFRFGVLVGDSVQGEFEKIDGPYFLMRFLSQFASSPASKWIKSFALPMSTSGILPIVPVDQAAKVLHRALFMEPSQSEQTEYFGVYHSKSISPDELCRAIFKEFLPSCNLKLLSPQFPKVLLRAQSKVTKIPKDVFNFALNPIPLSNTHFSEVFGESSISSFDSFREAFFKGFRTCLLGETYYASS